MPGWKEKCKTFPGEMPLKDKREREQKSSGAVFRANIGLSPVKGKRS